MLISKTIAQIIVALKSNLINRFRFLLGAHLFSWVSRLDGRDEQFSLSRFTTQGEIMNNEFRNIIKVLCDKNKTGEELGTPDGVVDISGLIRSLKWLTKEGRPVKSDEAGALMAMLGNWKLQEFGGGTVEDLNHCVVAQDMLLMLVLKAVQRLKPDLCPEEILMDACNQDMLEKLAIDMKATAYRQEENGEIVIDYFGHEIFDAPFVIDDFVKHSFNRRQVTPSFYTDEAEPKFIFEVVDEGESESLKETERLAIRKVNLSDFENLIADPMNGFDEFWIYFFDSDHLLIELGIDFDDLPPFSES